MNLKIAIFLSFLFTGHFFLSAQNKTVKTYYDVEKKQKKEEYRINDKDSTELEGLYKTYYQNGKPKTVGFYTNNQATDYWEYFYQNGNLKMEGLINNFINEGHWIYYYENGHKSHEGNMDKGKKNGYWRYYYEDGKIKTEGYFKDNKNDGEWKYYYDDGDLKAVGQYNSGTGHYTEFYPDGVIKAEGKIKQGKSDSVWKYYYPNKQLKAIGIETNGVKDGEWKYYYDNGNPSSVGYYSKGQTNGYWRYYYENGNLSSQGVEKEGQKEGQWKMFYSSGKAKGVGEFRDGDGPYTEFHDNGKPKLKGQFRRGKYEGRWEYYYEDGTLEGECLYNNGEGWYTGYYEDQTKKIEGMLTNGNKTGVWKLYKKDGSIAGYYRTYYDDGGDENPNLKPKSDSLVFVKKPVKIDKKPKSAHKSKPWRLRLYKPDPLVYKTFIFSAEPINLAFGANLPINLEYYVQQKWGFEVSLTYYRKPFFSSPEKQALNADFQQGFGYGFRYKKYFFNDDFIGMPYIAGELRGRTIQHSARVIDSSMVTSKTQQVQLEVNENNYEFNILLGDRLMKEFDRSGFSIDVYFGIGIGYKTFSRNYISKEAFDQLFNQAVNSSPFYSSFRFGLSLGYAF